MDKTLEKMPETQLKLFSSQKSKTSTTTPFSIEHLQKKKDKPVRKKPNYTPRKNRAVIEETLSASNESALMPEKQNSSQQLGDIYAQLVEGLQKFFEKNQFFKAVIGLSGGIDSTVTLKIAVDALGPENITGMIMPELGLTSQLNINHAKMLGEYFGINYYYVPINQFLMDFKVLPWRPSPIAEMNTKARIRMCMLYSYANTIGALVLGTGNRSEIMAGYATKHGDAACDILPIGDLKKTDVFQLARYLELPDEIINKKPTAELRKGQTDEDEMGMSYRELDSIINFENEGPQAAIAKGINPALVHKAFSMFEKSDHKRKTPPIIKIKK